MNIVLLTEKGESYGVRDHLQSLKVDTKLVVSKKGDYHSVLGDKAEISYNWRSFASSGDLFFSTSDQYGRIIDILAENGKTVLGGRSSIKSFLDASVTIKERCEPLDPKRFYYRVDIGKFFSGTKWVSPTLFSFPMTRLMEREKGPLADMGAITFAAKSQKMDELIFNLIEKELIELNHCGYFGVELLISSNSMTFLNATTNLSNAAFYSLKELFKGTWKSILSSLPLEGIRATQEQIPACSLLLVSPPFPYGYEGAFPLEITEHSRRHLYKIPWGYYVTSIGEDIYQAKSRVYRTIQKLNLDPEIQWRADLGYEFQDTMKTLKEWDYIASN